MSNTKTVTKPFKNSAVVVLSGGQDSVTCLGWAMPRFDQVYAIGFSYGQKHEIELTQAGKICSDLIIPFQVFEIPALAELSDSALTTAGDVNLNHHRLNDLPASFVPNRNTLFLTIAHAYAQKVGADDLVTGVCQTDYSGYPDCREEFIEKLEDTLNTGYQTNIIIHTPLMHLDKAQTFAVAERNGILEKVIEDSHTCYNGDHETYHAWGYGCGECPACKLRAAGYSRWLEGNYDPLPEGV